MAESSQPSCIFCRIVAGQEPAAIIYEDEQIIVFLDQRPVFVGHCLVAPKAHIPTLIDIPEDLLADFFGKVQQTAKVVKVGMQAQGTFVAMNNTVSQSVPHLHVHVVPRTKGDGLRGFFWPRHRYREDQMTAIKTQLTTTWQELIGV